MRSPRLGVRKWIALPVLALMVLLSVWVAWALLGMKQPVAWANLYSLELSAHPVRDDPMTVRFTATIRGGVDFAPGLYCQPREWRIDDTRRVEFGMCKSWGLNAQLPRVAQYTHTFEGSGTYTVQVSYGWLESETVDIIVPWQTGSGGVLEALLRLVGGPDLGTVAA